MIGITGPRWQRSAAILSASSDPSLNRRSRIGHVKEIVGTNRVFRGNW